MEVIWTKAAMADLKAIYEYRKQKSGVEAARKFRKKIFGKTSPLKSFPLLGKKSSAPFKNQEIRYLVEKPYRIVYRIQEDEIEIIAITDSRSDPGKYIY